MIKYRYSHEYFPPVPVVEVMFVTAAESLRAGPFPAIIDSGADATIVPIEHLDLIHAPTTIEKSVRTQWGDRHSVMLYLVDVQVGTITLPGIEVIGDEISQEIIIGRDVLNRLRVLLNGLQETVEVSE